jgi:sulfhydrogenase subunit alpha
MTHRSRQLRVSALARIEGEGALRVVVQDGQVLAAELQIYEPPRFFEAFLRGRQHTEVTDITSRICGICPVAYQTSAWNAIEDACGVSAGDAVTALRRLLYCGEWISSHTLHIYMLHAPDFLGYPDVIALARDHRDLVERGLRLKKAGNAILEAVGGRAIHPVNTRVGGFYRAPAKAELVPLAEQLRQLSATRWRQSPGWPASTSPT